MPITDDTTSLIFPASGAVAAALCPPAELLCCAASGPGGHALTVMLDTGTDPSAVDLRLARRLVIATGGSGVGQGAASDAVAFTEAIVPWLRIGDLAIRDLLAPAIDLSTLPVRVDLVLGYNVLRQLALRVDFGARTLALAHPDVGAPGVGAALALEFFEQFPALPHVTIDGLRVACATIDTGSNAALTVGPDLAERLGLRAGAPGVRLARAAGFGGEVAVLRRDGARVQIGPFTLDDVAIDAQVGRGGDLGRAGRANIGVQLLARFGSVALDYGRRTLTLTPPEPR